MLVSNCCGASPRNEFEEEGCICSSCGDHCEYIEEEEEQDDVSSIDYTQGICDQTDADDRMVE